MSLVCTISPSCLLGLLAARPGLQSESNFRFRCYRPPLTGVTAHQQTTGRADSPKWARLLAVALQEFSQEALKIALEESEFSRREISASRPTRTRRRRGRDDPHQCRMRKRATRRGHEKL